MTDKELAEMSMCSVEEIERLDQAQREKLEETCEGLVETGLYEQGYRPAWGQTIQRHVPLVRS
jgi:hypothetical protein